MGKWGGRRGGRGVVSRFFTVGKLLRHYGGKAVWCCSGEGEKGGGEEYGGCGGGFGRRWGDRKRGDRGELLGGGEKEGVAARLSRRGEEEKREEDGWVCS
ncbi:hypothetical protein HAX54_023034 [Datura stramonium]|uniref:Uncharacterized protein n=1 Tax=Datura stramonium TaxID=4076 RepID=A0ABS8UXY2_DATST|nr:hypothetical protein [Datura stramonium]